MTLNNEVLSILTMGLLVLVIILLVAIFVLFAKMSTLTKKYKGFMKYSNNGGTGIEDALNGCVGKIDELRKVSADQQANILRLKKEIKLCAQKIAVVRYNAFDNVGSDQSFSIALLDQNNDGFVVSGIYTRSGSSTYAKPISASTSHHALSTEEIQAIEVAKKNFGENC